MKTDELNYIGQDPGAVKYGNFINYYSFHSTVERIQNLHPSMFPPSENGSLFCLDIGCNTGDLTKELHKCMSNIYPHSNIHILAVDIDPNLINRAQESNDITTICYRTLNIMDETDCKLIQSYLNSFARQTFDITFCFSVTMWIHLNNGDDGLFKFLQYIKDMSAAIIVEPQPWICYRNAQRRIKKSGSSFPLYETLKVRSNIDIVIDEILLKNTHRKVYESPSSNWKRKIKCYQQATN